MRHPALPPSNHLLQLPSKTSGNTLKPKGRNSLIKSLSKGKVDKDHQDKLQAITEDIVVEVGEFSIPQSPIRDLLLTDDKVSLKVIYHL